MTRLVFTFTAVVTVAFLAAGCGGGGGGPTADKIVAMLALNDPTAKPLMALPGEAECGWEQSPSVDAKHDYYTCEVRSPSGERVARLSCNLMSDSVGGVMSSVKIPPARYGTFLCETWQRYERLPRHVPGGLRQAGWVHLGQELRVAWNQGSSTQLGL